MTTPPLEEPSAPATEASSAATEGHTSTTESAEPATSIDAPTAATERSSAATDSPTATADDAAPAIASGTPTVSGGSAEAVEAPADAGPATAPARRAEAARDATAARDAEAARDADAADADAATPNPDIDELVMLDRSTVTVARYADYAGAQRAVDYLSDNGFPVERTAIIGTDLRLVENVLGRLTVGRAALAGIASGAWFGLFVGILFTLFSNSNWLGILVTTILVGALWGGVFGAIAHALTGGRRDFTSRSSLQAGQYAVTVEAEYADEARALITRQNWRAANA